MYFRPESEYTQFWHSLFNVKMVFKPHRRWLMFFSSSVSASTALFWFSSPLSTQVLPLFAHFSLSTISILKLVCSHFLCQVYSTIRGCIKKPWEYVVISKSSCSFLNAVNNKNWTAKLQKIPQQSQIGICDYRTIAETCFWIQLVLKLSDQSKVTGPNSAVTIRS